MKSLGLRILGLTLIPLAPALALLALWAFRHSRRKEDHSYLYNLRMLLKEDARLIMKGKWL